MSFSADQVGMKVVVPGSSRISRDQYTGDGSTTFSKGDLIRINTSGQVVDAATDTDTSGAVHGMILEDWSTAPTTSQYPVLMLFGSDTILETQVYNATAGDSEPQDITLGNSYTLRNGGSGKWSITTDTTKGIALAVAKPSQNRYFDSQYDADQDYGFVHIRFIQSILDAHAA